MKLKLTPVVVSLCLMGAVGYAQNVAPNSEAKKLVKLEKQVAQEQTEIKDLQKAQNPPSVANKEQQSKIEHTGSIFGGSAVRIGPFIGDAKRRDGSMLIVNAHSVNEDRALLRLRQKEQAAIDKAGVQLPAYPRLVFSGKVEGTGSYMQHDTSISSGANSKTDFDLTGAEIDSLVEVSNWVNGFMTFNYDNTPPAIGPTNRMNNSRLFVNKAFLMIGNLDKLPLYASFGQLYVPFGQFSSGLVSAPLTQTFGRVKERAITLNYVSNGADPDKSGVFASAYAYKSALLSSPHVNSGGGNVGFIFNNEGWSAKAAAGVISNLADGEGSFSGGVTAPFTTLQYNVPGFDANTQISKGPFAILAEYVTALRPYSMTDMTFNGVAAKPSALTVEGDYSFTTGQQPSSIVLAYGSTHQAAAMGLPHYRYSVAFNTSFWNDTLESLEFHHDVNYPAGTTATSAAGSGFTPVIGGSNNVVLLAMDLYF